MTAFQIKQQHELRADRREQLAAFSATHATAEIGIISNIAGTYTVNTINGSKKRNFENVPFPSKVAALKAYAAQFGTGTLKASGNNTYLIFTK